MARTLAIWASLLVSTSAATEDQLTIETFDAAIRAGDNGWSHIVFAKADQPAVLVKAPQGGWDWSAGGKLIIPVENPGDEPLPLVLRIESAPSGALRGNVTIAPHSVGDLVMWLDAPPPRAMGMTGGPSLKSAGLKPDIWPVRVTGGSADASHVTSFRLGTWRPPSPRSLAVGPLRVVPPDEADRIAYDKIVDGFGQYRPGSWPEKVSSVEMLRRRGEEEARQLAQWRAEAPKRDRFGGFKGGLTFRATGFFRAERRDGRWWLVTPDGNAFFSIGMDAARPGGATYIEGREFMFNDLPARDGEFAEHWSEHDDRLGLPAQRGRAFDHGRAFDFFTANLERKFGADWRARWREETATRLEAWGFNTIGNWGDPELWGMHRLPYTVPLWPLGGYAMISSEDWWGPIADPFDPRFAEAVDKMARDAAARFRGDPYLVGYFVGNELSWGRDENPRARYGLAINALAAGPQSPANFAFVAYLIETYREPERLAKAWGVSLTSWEALRAAGLALPPKALDNPAVIADLAAFSHRFADAYFRTVAEALRRHDPDHLYLGSRFAWQTSEAVEACARWCDVVSFNRYVRSLADDPEEWARFHRLGKPALIGEFHFGSVDRGLFWDGLVGVGRESERGPAYAGYLRSVADNPDFVGAHWFQYSDQPLAGRTYDGENAHVGFVTVADVTYQDFVAAARQANLTVLDELRRIGAQ